MNLEALRKLLTSSKVLMFLVFAAAITTALKLGLVDAAWYQSTIATAFYALLGGYSAVEAARALGSDKVIAAQLLEEPEPGETGYDEDSDK